MYAYERASSRLYVRSRPSGRRVARYGEEQMQDLLGELKGARNAELRRIEQEAKDLLGEALREKRSSPSSSRPMPCSRLPSGTPSGSAWR
jgi:hypothetical protein